MKALFFVFGFIFQHIIVGTNVMAGEIVRPSLDQELSYKVHHFEEGQTDSQSRTLANQEDNQGNRPLAQERNNEENRVPQAYDQTYDQRELKNTPSFDPLKEKDEVESSAVKYWKY